MKKRLSFSLCLTLIPHISNTADNSSSALVNLQRGQKPIKTLTGHTDVVNSIAFSPDGTKIASGSSDWTVRLWDVDTGEQIGAPLAQNRYVKAVAFNPNSSNVASGPGPNTVIRLWNANSKQQIHEISTDFNDIISSLAFSPDGKKLAAGSHDGTICILSSLNAARPRIEQMRERAGIVVRCVDFAPDNNMFASAGSTIDFWNINTRKKTGESLRIPEEYIYSIAFSPDGTKLVSGGSDKAVRLWDVNARKKIGEPLTGHTGWVNAVAFSPDGETIASGSDDETVRLWNVSTGEQIGEPLQGHSSEITSVKFSPDGRLLASGSYDETIKIWQLMIPTLRQMAASVIRQHPEINEQAKILIPLGTQQEFGIGDRGQTLEALEALETMEELLGALNDLD